MSLLKISPSGGVGHEPLNLYFYEVLVRDGVCVLVELVVGVLDFDGVVVTEGVPDLLGVTDGDTEGVRDLLGVTDGVPDLLGVVVTLGVPDLVRVIVFVGLTLGVKDEVPDLLGVPVMEGEDP